MLWDAVGIAPAPSYPTAWSKLAQLDNIEQSQSHLEPLGLLMAEKLALATSKGFQEGVTSLAKRPGPFIQSEVSGCKAHLACSCLLLFWNHLHCLEFRIVYSRHSVTIETVAKLNCSLDLRHPKGTAETLHGGLDCGTTHSV